MPNLSDHDTQQMDEIWQSAQSEPVVRSVLMRTLEDLRVARDRLNQNASNSSRLPGSMPPSQRGHTVPVDSDLHSESSEKDGDNTGDGDAATKACFATKAVNQPAVRGAGPAVGDPGHGHTQKLPPTNFFDKHPTHCVACQHPFTAQAPAQAWTAWDTLELRPLSTPTDTAPLRLGLHIEVTRHTLMQQHCACGHVTRDLMRKLCGVSESTDQRAALAGKVMFGLFAELMSGVFQASDRHKALPLGVHDDPPEPPVVTHAQQVSCTQGIARKTPRCRTQVLARHWARISQ